MVEKEEHLESQIANLSYLESLYHEPIDQLDASWPILFQKIEQKRGISTKKEPSSSRSESIFRLAEAYRHDGHLAADINPIALSQSLEPQQLDLEKLGFKESEREALFPTLGLLPESEAPLSSIVKLLKRRYCGSVGIEFKEFTPSPVEEWIQKEIETGRLEKPLTLEEKLVILDTLTRAEVLENFLHTKHVGKKRFSLEGGETLIPMLNLMIAQAAEEKVEEFFIGMSHRGRLNVLANVLQKPLSKIFNDFDEEYVPERSEGMGDIRYHKGHGNPKVETYKGKTIRLSMAPNPSHLESVNPVIEGQVHAKQFLNQDESSRDRIIPLLLHGDAAIAGQGIVYEILQMGKLPGFETGGTLHLVINNQIGFTTPPQEARSTQYCTDIAKTFGAPVFHVNAEDPDSCVRVMLLAYEIRQKFHCDVFVDLNCYRKYGHNEGDEPAFTQPLEYRIIRQKKSIRALYLDQLIENGEIDKKVADGRDEALKKHLQEVYLLVEQKNEKEEKKSDLDHSYSFDPIQTKVDIETLERVVDEFSKIPAQFNPHPKIAHLINERAKVIREDRAFDWGTAEYLAYGSLVWEGVPVRLAGQDAGRGTFSHRHALWVDQVNNQEYFSLAHLREGQGRFEVLNTCLSEAAALGFEYGYTTVCTKGLTIWEAQFGDFVNSAQVIIDQYIASGEQKWGQTTRLVLFLPHGFEGQGPEHSSARFERFLSLAGHDNMQIINPTTPAQMFHLLRRQVKQDPAKPLVVMTPKGLLRHPLCVSKVKDLVEGEFHPFIEDASDPHQARRLVICSGRIYYDLIAYREKTKQNDISILRLEQLYPLDFDRLKKAIDRYDRIKDCVWVQEEPENMGAWPYLSSILPHLLSAHQRLSYVGRERSASPATGFLARHKQELADILAQVFKNEN